MMYSQLLSDFRSALSTDTKKPSRIFDSSSQSNSRDVDMVNTSPNQLAHIASKLHCQVDSQPAHLRRSLDHINEKQLASVIFSQTNPWAHPLNWTMPPKAYLLEFLHPILAQAVVDSEFPRECICFCALVLHETQRFLDNQTAVNLAQDYPRDLAHYIATLKLFLTPTVVAIPAKAIRDHEKVVGSDFTAAYLRQRTLSEHISQLIEGFIVTTAIQLEPAVDGAHVPQQRSMAPAVTTRSSPGLRIWGRMKNLLREAREKFRIRTYSSAQDDSVFAIREQPGERRGPLE